MSTIKPPDGRAADGIGSASPNEGLPTDGSRGAERAGPSFRETLVGPSAGAAQTTPLQAAGPAAASQAAASSALADAVRRGTLTADQAIDQLLEQTLARTARLLSESQRVELRAVLYEAMQSDPALRDLRDAIG